MRQRSSRRDSIIFVCRRGDFTLKCFMRIQLGQCYLIDPQDCGFPQYKCKMKSVLSFNTLSHSSFYCSSSHFASTSSPSYISCFCVPCFHSRSHIIFLPLLLHHPPAIYPPSPSQYSSIFFAFSTSVSSFHHISSLPSSHPFSLHTTLLGSFSSSGVLSK